MGTGLVNPTHLLFLAVLALLLFGAKRLPEIGRALGGGLREFKSSVAGVDGATEAIEEPNEIRSAVSSEVDETRPVRLEVAAGQDG